VCVCVCVCVCLAVNIAFRDLRCAEVAALVFLTRAVGLPNSCCFSVAVTLVRLPVRSLSSSQLAYYRLHGRPCATYETAHTRLFARGRTETIRCVLLDLSLLSSVCLYLCVCLCLCLCLCVCVSVVCVCHDDVNVAPPLTVRSASSDTLAFAKAMDCPNADRAQREKLFRYCICLSDGAIVLHDAPLS
jgi:hypothetical protein